MPDNEKYPLALPKGTVLAGQYIIEYVLGQGGFGITYAAADHATNQKVAVKEFFPDTLAFRETATQVQSYTGERAENFEYGKECFLTEARTLAEFIGCEGVVRIISYFEENGTAYFVMEYIDGESFDDYIKQHGGKIGIEDAKRILIPIMDALAAVHAKGIVHRDVTPDNIYITRDGDVKLLDFGAARYSLGDKSRSLDVILKHGFAPKEQYTRHGKQGPFTDIYSLGATFYFALTGRRPPDAIDRIEQDDIIPPSTLGASLTEYQEEAIMQAMAVQPNDRFQSMAVFKQVLLNEEPAVAAQAQTSAPVKQIVFAAPTTPVAPPVAPVAPTALGVPGTAQKPTAYAQPTVKKRGAGKIAAIIGGSAAVVVLLIVLIVSLAGGKDSDIDTSRDTTSSRSSFTSSSSAPVDNKNVSTSSSSSKSSSSSSSSKPTEKVTWSKMPAGLGWETLANEFNSKMGSEYYNKIDSTLFNGGYVYFYNGVSINGVEASYVSLTTDSKASDGKLVAFSYYFSDVQLAEKIKSSLNSEFGKYTESGDVEGGTYYGWIVNKNWGITLTISNGFTILGYYDPETFDEAAPASSSSKPENELLTAKSPTDLFGAEFDMNIEQAKSAIGTATESGTDSNGYKYLYFTAKQYGYDVWVYFFFDESGNNLSEVHYVPLNSYEQSNWIKAYSNACLDEWGTAKVDGSTSVYKFDSGRSLKLIQENDVYVVYGY